MIQPHAVLMEFILSLTFPCTATSIRAKPFEVAPVMDKPPQILLLYVDRVISLQDLGCISLEWSQR